MNSDNNLEQILTMEQVRTMMKCDHNMKLLLARGAVCLGLAALWAGQIRGSGAYLTDRADKVNVMLASETEIHIDENFEPPVNPVPGSSFVKEPRIVNDAASSCSVRARIEFSTLEGEKACMAPEINAAWVRGEDGYYYYDRILEAGQTTLPLFSRIRFREDLTQEELDAALPFEIYVYAEAFTGKEMDQE